MKKSCFIKSEQNELLEDVRKLKRKIIETKDEIRAFNEFNQIPEESFLRDSSTWLKATSFAALLIGSRITHLDASFYIDDIVGHGARLVGFSVGQYAFWKNSLDSENKAARYRKICTDAAYETNLKLDFHIKENRHGKYYMSTSTVVNTAIFTATTAMLIFASLNKSQQNNESSFDWHNFYMCMSICGDILSTITSPIWQGYTSHVVRVCEKVWERGRGIFAQYGFFGREVEQAQREEESDEDIAGESAHLLHE